MNSEFLAALEQVEKDKGIDKEYLIDAIETALLSAYKREFGLSGDCKGRVNRKTGDMGVYMHKTVVEEIEDPATQMALSEAKKISSKYQEGDSVEINVMPKSFGRIAAQTAKQVVVQRIREAERHKIATEFSEKKDEIVSGLIQRIEQGTYNNMMVEIGNVEAAVGPNERVPGERLLPGEKAFFYVMDVKDDFRGAQIILSRTHPGLVKRLFEREVPEIADGVVVIKAIAREAGFRTKIAVYSTNPDVDAIGACVGPKGMRVANILHELRGEKVDIIHYSEQPDKFISAALSPAQVIKVDVDEEAHACEVHVPESQLSLAIGREGQNARLAAKLTSWKIDIKSIKGD